MILPTIIPSNILIPEEIPGTMIVIEIEALTPVRATPKINPIVAKTTNSAKYIAWILFVNSVRQNNPIPDTTPQVNGPRP
ncbi:MAG: hypothetical protein ACI87E_003426 [Mariniblastus sp.]|jgi:hypothetical protein